jgi:hypothetical protein
VNDSAGRKRIEGDAPPAGHRHLGDRDEEAAIGNVVAGGDLTGADQAAHEIAVMPLGGEIDRWRQAVLASLDLALAFAPPCTNTA